MQTINDLTKGQTPQQLVASAQTSQQHALPEAKAVEFIWQTMTSMFGHKWVSSYGAEVDPDKVWAACLKGISPEQIKSGLNQCASRGLEWPPSAPQFRALCLGLELDDDGNDSSWQHRVHAKRAAETAKLLADNRLRLTDQGKRDRAVAARNAHAEKLKAMFAGTGQ